MIAISTTDHIATLTLDRSAARNALRIADWDALAAAIRDLPLTVRALVLHGGASFCAGADLRELETLRDDSAMRPRFRIAMATAIEALAACPVPVIAGIAGGCYGAGVALAIAADIRIAAPDATFATTPARLGIGYPATDVARLASRIGQGHAARLLFSAQPIPADEALRIGLVEQLADDPIAAAHAIAATIADNAPAAVRLLKRVLRHPDEAGHDAAFEARFGTAAFTEGLTAFAGKRKPDFP
ncbi:enoyl-CoA hydratase/isomerase family protein [Sphingomonas sp. S1-29]|uniref:enoyl-CoA hydratase/isomerase family protein n=1 Tax=Sphingomonas sp. S1-29 TaxID=2991074 RepID=UPI00223F009A|nr:enoyl-CoA hydratase/isomerase family protein [Sphingomonas sp. S1-29]UZK69942.1 enoyl-CoA hydratase/isomerase family protein [Sphingomonas sp. S1-29]